MPFPIALKWADKDLCKRKLTEKNELWFSQVTESEMQTTCDSAKTWLSRNSLELKSQQTACFSSLRFFSILLHPLNTALWKVDWYVQERKQKNKLILWCAHSFAFNCGIISGRIRDVFLSVRLWFCTCLVSILTLLLEKTSPEGFIRMYLLISLVLVEFSTKLRRDYMRERCDNRFFLLFFEFPEIYRFLESCRLDPRKILRVSRNSILEPRTSIASRIEERVSSRDCQLTFARYCSTCPE